MWDWVGFFPLLCREEWEIKGDCLLDFAVLSEDVRTRVIGGGVADSEALSVGESGFVDEDKELLTPRVAERSGRRLRGASVADDWVMERCGESPGGEY